MALQDNLLSATIFSSSKNQCPWIYQKYNAILIKKLKSHETAGCKGPIVKLKIPPDRMDIIVDWKSKFRLKWPHLSGNEETFWEKFYFFHFPTNGPQCNLNTLWQETTDQNVVSIFVTFPSHKVNGFLKVCLVIHSEEVITQDGNEHISFLRFDLTVFGK